MKSSVNPKASRSELSMASASSMVFVLPSARSQIWDAENILDIYLMLKTNTYVIYICTYNQRFYINLSKNENTEMIYSHLEIVKDVTKEILRRNLIQTR